MGLFEGWPLFLRRCLRINTVNTRYCTVKWLGFGGNVRVFLAVSESTPGPIMVNMATYIGSSQAGFLGAVLATAGVVIPSFIIILVIVALLNNFIENKYVQSVLMGIRPCFIGIVLATGIYMVIDNIFPEIKAIVPDWHGLLLSCVLFALSLGYQKAKSKDLSPILIITISAVMGIAIYSF